MDDHHDYFDDYHGYHDDYHGFHDVCSCPAAAEWLLLRQAAAAAEAEAAEAEAAEAIGL